MKTWTTDTWLWALCEISISPKVKMVVRREGEKYTLFLEGPTGKSSLLFPKIFSVKKKDEQTLTFRYFLPRDSKGKKELFSTYKSLIKQKLEGVSQGFNRQLNLLGVGYRAVLKNSSTERILQLRLGFSHLIEISFDKDIEILCPNQRTIFIKGVDLIKVSQKAAEIRSWRLPEPYKGKGIFYKEEIINRKEGKKN